MSAHQLTELVDAFGNYLAIDDYAHILFALAIAVGAHEETGEPCWGLIVGPPSSGKTESLRALDTIADEHLDEITAPGLLSWLPGKDPKPTGMLARNQGRVFATVGDLSTLLAKSDRGDRDQLYSLLRRAYDGSVVREVGNSSGPLRWKGRLTLLAAVTPAVDRYSSHSDELGPRWLYMRIPASTSAQRRESARMMRASARRLREHRERVRDLATAAVEVALPRGAEIGDELGRQLDDAAIVACLGRAAVPRDGYGRREIIGVATIEEPPRLVAQLEKLTRSAIMLGLDDRAAGSLAVRAALDSMPLARRAVLAELAGGEQLAQAEIARRAHIDRSVARVALEDLAAIGVATYEGAESDEDGKRGPWRLTGEDAPAIAAALTHAADVAKSVLLPPIPPERGKEAEHSSQHRNGTDPAAEPPPSAVEIPWASRARAHNPTLGGAS